MTGPRQPAVDKDTLIKVMEEDYGYTHDPNGYLLLKITQLIELLGIRRSNMVLPTMEQLLDVDNPYRSE